MKNFYIISLMLLLLWTITTHAQPSLMYGLAKKSGLVKEVYFSTVNPATGSVSILSSSYITNHITMGGATLDFYNNRYYYFAPGTGNSNLYAVDILTGNVSYYTSLTYPTGYNFSLIQFNCSDSALYGIYGSAGSMTSAEINPNTGAVTSSGNLVAASSQDDYTYDKKNNIYFFKNASTEIKGVNLLNGTLISSTLISLPAGEYFENIDYNCSDSTLYGTYRNPSGLKFAKINLTTGAVTVLSSSPFTPSWAGGGHILDEEEGKYYINTGTQIFTINVSNGALLNSAMLSFSMSGTFGLYYIKKEIDCDCLNSTFINEANLSDQYILYPNPLINELLVKTNGNNWTEIILYDLTARKILQKAFTSSVSINTEHLAKGVYLYEVRNKTGIIKTGKVVKQ